MERDDDSNEEDSVNFEKNKENKLKDENNEQEKDTNLLIFENFI